ncbi:hypothetical protein [Pseudomonas nitroreducens]|uniref:hypothetical protein n=1 Tax=Pseudomonas nitroreducens TaxID=46680 RepID=UPI003CC8398C
MKKPKKKVIRETSKQRIEKLEKQIQEAEALLETLAPGRGAGLANQIAQLRRRLRLEQIHAISGFNRIRHHTVSGCYGSGRKTN